MNLESTVKKYRDLIKLRAPQIKLDHDSKGHGYISPVGNERYKSVTFFTAMIKDPSLANYKMNRALDFLKSWFDIAPFDGLRKVTPLGVEEILEQAKLAPESEFLNAGDVGTQTHAWRQQFFESWIESGKAQLSHAEIDANPLPENAAPEVISGCRAIKKFLKDTGYIPVACELPLVDDKLKVGGTIDDLGVFPNPYTAPYDGDTPEFKGGYTLKFDPQLVFIDLKTSNQGKKPAYAYQVRGFYQGMIKNTLKLRPKKTYILHTSKENGTYQLIDLTDMKFLESAAANLVLMSRQYDMVLDAFKPKVRVV